MAIAEDRPRLDPGIRDLLTQLRGQIRRYVWIEGIATSVATLCAAFWLALAVDYYFEPTPAARYFLLVVAAAATATVFYRFVLRRMAVPLSDTSLALLLERRFRYFDDSLLTSVDLTQDDRDLGELGREMLVHTCHEAAHRARDVSLDEIFRRAPMARAVGAAGILVASLGVFLVASPGTFRFGIDRLAGLTSEPWPRQTKLLVPGFEDGEKVVAKGDDLPILVQADISAPRVPEVVQIRYRTDEGNRGRETMTREGNARPGEDEYQDFRHTFTSVLSSLSFDVIGGDARIRDLRVRVVDSPTVSETTLLCEYPAYMNRAPRELEVSGSMQIQVGTRITVRARANKDLERAQIDYQLDDKTAHTETVTLPGAEGNRRDFRFTLPSFDSDKTLAFTLFDTDRIHNRKPFVVSLSAVADEPPQLSLRLRGIGTAITPQARLPLAGTIVDDYQIASAAFNVTVDDHDPQYPPFSAPASGRSEIDVDEAFEVRDLGLKPGAKLIFGAQATDAFHLVDGDAPHTATSERFQLDVVSPEALRAMLELRELNLRQRFETIIAEVTETRDSLTELAHGPAEDSAADAADDSSPLEDQSLVAMRVERARQNSEKNAQETLGVAASFEEIREELINNRVDTEELKVRLKDRIADPLRVVGEQMFPEWDRRLKTLMDQLGDAKGTAASDGAAGALSSSAARRAAIDQGDAILIEMTQIRDKMLELESFNEAVDMLRAIITAEKALQGQVRERQKRKVRDLLEDSQ